MLLLRVSIVALFTAHVTLAVDRGTIAPALDVGEPVLALWSGTEHPVGMRTESGARSLAFSSASLPAALLAVFAVDADIAAARRNLEGTGVRVDHYVPESAFSIYVTDAQQLSAVHAIKELHAIVPVRPTHKGRGLAIAADAHAGLVAATVAGGSASDACAVASGLASRITRAGGRVRILGAKHGACGPRGLTVAQGSNDGSIVDDDNALVLRGAPTIGLLVTPGGSRVVVAALDDDHSACAPPNCGPVPAPVIAWLSDDARVTALEATGGAPVPANAYARGALQSSDPFNFLDGAPHEYGACAAPSPSTCYSQAIPAPPGFNLPDRIGAAAGASTSCSDLACGQAWEATDSRLGASPLTALGLDGSRQLLGVADSGVDTNHPYFFDSTGAAVPVTRARPDPFNISMSHRKISTYFAFMDADDFDGHGTHCAGTTGGSLQLPGSIGSLDKYRGMAPNARFVIWDHECSPGNSCTCPPGYPCTCDFSPGGVCHEVDGAFVMPLDVWQTQAALYDAGARVSSNSWDDSDLYRFQVPFYTQSASDFDGFLYNHPDFLAVFAAANSGRGSYGTGVAYTTVGAPGSAKNTLCVGATQHDALSQVDLLTSVNPLGTGRNCRRIVQAWTNTSVDTCTLTAANKTCYELAYATPRDARAAIADLALCCGCTLADVLSTAPSDAQTQQSVYVALLQAYSSRVLATFSSRGPTVDGRQKPDVLAPGVETVSASSGSSLDAPVRPPGTWVCPNNTVAVSGLATTPTTGPVTVDNSGISFVLVTLEPTYIESVTLALAPGTVTPRVGLSLNGILPYLWAPVSVDGTNVTWNLRMGVPLSSRSPTLFKFVPDGGSFATIGNLTRIVLPDGERDTLPPAAACWGLHSGNVDITLVTARNDATRAPQHTYLVPYSGTSMATPAAAGTATVARQYFVDGWWPAGTGAGASPGFHPSAAMLKAVLINGASPLLARALSNTSSTPKDKYGQRTDFVYSSTHAQEGFGMLNLVRSLGIASLADGSIAAATLPTLLLPGLVLADAPAPRPAPASVTLRGVDPKVDHAQLVQWCVDITRNPAVHDGTSTSIPLRVTLVWTDPPASPLSATALVNNLDLEVVDPAGATLYRGNNDEHVWPHSIDAVNNVEKVVVRAPSITIDFATGARVARPWSIVVRGSHVPMGPQNFSLAISGAGARIAQSGSCGAPLAVGAFAADQTAPIPSSSGGEPTIGASVAGGIYAATIVALVSGFAILWRRRRRGAGSSGRDESEERPLL